MRTCTSSWNSSPTMAKPIAADRQVVFFRDVQLLDKQLALSFGVEALDIEIEPYLAHGDGLPGFQPRWQLFEMFVTVMGQKQRVQPIGRINAFTRCRQMLDGFPVSAIDGRYDPAPHARLGGPLEHGAAIGIKRAVVKVGVGVYQFMHAVCCRLAWWAQSKASFSLTIVKCLHGVLTNFRGESPQGNAALSSGEQGL